ncbi:MAG: alpha/beta hydrolase [Gammaproteobacteria bacterium]|jgi:pimeloyl-ACP methyl ester carboxylesterase|nr:alpha/beta hydrolase [Gammaproteobacteria bacterium]MBT5406361.1 alpha/beta hydrolase [Gammaproteobacteria bacterium]MBT5644391.1 alpha/beta hydrolase [Gammaproteobacteria bacterium]MBT5862932.1 alpha/beta hydrolase [Gammaproteobacteria bacterium]MBT6734035.1 alpha/beta hydrolase [Gammaproteobacteria bacterium]
MHDSNIIFLHGWLFDRRIWQGLDKLFYNKFNTYMHDFPGYGGNLLSDINSQEYCDNIFTNAKKNTIIVGYSYGGLLALNSFQSYQSNIDKLILINCNLDIKNKSNNTLNLNSIRDLQISLKSDKSKSLKRFIYECVKDSKHYKTEYSRLIKIFSDNSLPDTSVLLENLNDLKAPIAINYAFDRQKDILLINTEEDSFVSYKKVHTINNDIIKEERIPDLGHIPFMFGNDEIYTLINKFIGVR